MKFFFAILSLLLLVYLLLPGPKSITDFDQLPNSAKSKLSGDTVQVPNVTAYFSDNFRDFVMPFYIADYRKLVAIPFDPLRLNYPPEFAYTAIKDQTQSTYLEELVYPLRDSIFINGMEPFDKDGKARFLGATPFVQDEKSYQTKVTLRYYPSNIFTRVALWAGINISAILLWVTGKKVLFNG